MDNRLFNLIFVGYDFHIMAKTTSTAKLPGTIPAQEVPVTNPRNIESVYANHFGVSATMTDFTVYFLEMGQIPGPEGSVHKQEVKAIVTLPLMAAPGLLQILQQVIQNHGELLAEMKKQMGSGE